jgi:HK97 family phage major capsid protein
MSALDSIIQRYERELDDRKHGYEAILQNAERENREPNESEKETLKQLQARMKEINDELASYDQTDNMLAQFETRARDLDAAIQTRRAAGGEVQYRSAGQWARDQYLSSLGNRDPKSREAAARLEVYERAAAHIKTSDVPGVIPDPIVGEVINFIDAARPLVSFIGTAAIPSATWHRPIVSQHTAVALQGTAGEAGDEKAELTSQKLTITDLDGSAKTVGGYVNVSRQTIDFGPGLDFVIDDLAAQYAILTENMAADEIEATATTAVGYGASPTAATVAAALWEAVGIVYGVTKGRGRVFLALAPDVLGVFGPLFSPVNPQNAQSLGFSAGDFGQGVLGSISGVPVVVSAGFTAGDAFVLSTAAVELFEQRVGTLQVTEPSVLGTQVAYAGYFEALTITDDAIVPLTAT